MGYMIKQLRRLSIAGLLVFASVGFAQYTMDLTGVGDGAVADGVYVSPYQGTISQGADQLYSGYMICDDFTDESYVGDTWNAAATNAGALTGSELFTTSQTSYSVQQNYDAVAWLANQLLLSSNLNNSTNQTNISFAIWDIMDGATTNPDGGTGTLITQAFNEVINDHYVGSNVTVFTPSPKQGIGSNVSQEFLVVQAPEPPAAALLGFDLLSVLAIFFLLRRYRVRA
jgi:hypothetical protein